MNEMTQKRILIAAASKTGTTRQCAILLAGRQTVGPKSAIWNGSGRRRPAMIWRLSAAACAWEG